MSLSNWELPGEPSTLTLLASGVFIIGLYLWSTDRWRFYWESRQQRLGLENIALATVDYEERFRLAPERLFASLRIVRAKLSQPCMNTFRVPDVPQRLMNAVEIARAGL